MIKGNLIIDGPQLPAPASKTTQEDNTKKVITKKMSGRARKKARKAARRERLRLARAQLAMPWDPVVKKMLT